ncbi:hypothetical protein [Mordavella massiliensis]|uniref:alanine transaminase n=1 Tax=Mordavella massiliensis TaxID=1871024 RepID=A0A939BH56_9CLOT|nr:hypothetical protein [Mordavella massiliensis]MBM6948624.1 hypothetical protein [Mordavella massiliensis]
MKKIKRADKMNHVHSDIRGPLYVRAMEMQRQGRDVLKLNTGNPAAFAFGLPDSIRNALDGHLEEGVGYCDFKGMPKAREAICEYEKSKGILVIPGSGFDWQQPDHFRIVMLPEAKVLTDAVRRMGNFLDGYRQNM